MPKMILIRPAEPGDHAFIFSTYLKNKFYSKDQATTLKKATWMSMQHKRIEKLLKDAPVFVACLSDDLDTIVGYAFQDGDSHFQYIKLDWRNPALKVSEKLSHKLENP